jgi:hypothetical protein
MGIWGDMYALRGGMAHISLGLEVEEESEE